MTGLKLNISKKNDRVEDFFLEMYKLQYKTLHLQMEVVENPLKGLFI